MLKPFSERPYRPCVGIMLINDHGLVFVAQRIDQVVEAWQMPQGGIDKSEEPQESVMRELEEEIGTGSAEIMACTEDWLSYDLPENLVGKVWKGKYRGQKQLWYAMRFTGRDEDIDINTKHPEFTRWKWVEFETISKLIVSFKREIYQEIIARFRHLAG